MEKTLQAGSVYLKANGQYVLILYEDPEHVQFEVLSPPPQGSKGARGVLNARGNWSAPGDRRTISRRAFLRSMYKKGGPSSGSAKEHKDE
jgi:hypothetical protein